MRWGRSRRRRKRWRMKIIGRKEGGEVQKEKKNKRAKRWHLRRTTRDKWKGERIALSYVTFQRITTPTETFKTRENRKKKSRLLYLAIPKPSINQEPKTPIRDEENDKWLSLRDISYHDRKIRGRNTQDAANTGKESVVMRGMFWGGRQCVTQRTGWQRSASVKLPPYVCDGQRESLHDALE